MIRNIILSGVKKGITGSGYLAGLLYDKGIPVETFHGIRLRLDPYQMIDHEIIVNGYFDKEVLGALLGQLKEGDVFWDVGANMGLHSLTVKKLVKNLECHSFEPLYSNFARLSSNQALNPLLPVEKYNFGLSDQLSVVELFSTAGNHGRTSVTAMEHAKLTGAKIMAVTGDFLVSHRIKTPDIMKIDTEGHELQVLKGCEAILKSGKLRAVVYEALEHADSIRKFLEVHKFKVKSLDDKCNYLACRETG